MPAYHIDALARARKCAGCDADIKVGALALVRTPLGVQDPSSTYRHWNTCIGVGMWKSVCLSALDDDNLDTMVGWDRLNAAQRREAQKAFDRFKAEDAAKLAQQVPQIVNEAIEEPKPKQPATAYIRWMAAERKSGRWDGVADSTKQLAAQWKEMTSAEKKPWKDQWEEAKAEWATAMAGWKERNPGAEAKKAKATKAGAAKKEKKRRKTESDISSSDSEGEGDAFIAELDDHDDIIASRPSRSPAEPKGKQEKNRPPKKQATSGGGQTASKKPKKTIATGSTPKTSGAALKLSKDAPPVWSSSKDVGANGEYDAVVIETQVGCDD